ncbi:MAG TPA: 23S rRNA (pseudouridine(1915)-N(3))-methyltransferase RlmH [Flavihumibacter sp.]|nr:23S rRNA (pseudouridine(1915)-N(3))-methyltransferase RlmH [Bacteroidota bacterium]HOA37282.1 23S rRNA (pseudouridine(1915)-N(3))-methyltransferase RlmH [Flavihumibacter sp.]HPZ87358.1 23S rRNA (pseudouridine(1915)-N(3))-methyltransferase RlmH [Flavihumibacter sp.]HQD10450.1 23S rRNA (pseudouridine(1915)-N(3))-methyltransferase RlmH [Flavihumibacter sp.]
MLLFLLYSAINRRKSDWLLKIILLSIGKQQTADTKAALGDFSTRINHYFSAEWKLIPPTKHTDPEAIKKAEAALVLAFLQKDDYLVVLDERGKNISSPELATLIQQRANESRKQMVFLIGGAYGVDHSILQRANFSWSLSKLVFPHQLVRLILAEQVYRACTILRNEKYHHD